MKQDAIESLLSNRNRNIGAMYAAERCPDYLLVLFVLLEARRNHELEVLREDLLRRIAEAGGVSCTGNPFEEVLDTELKQLEEWRLVVRRLEKTRLRSYKDVRRDLFRYRLAEETIAFLGWLEERRENDLLPREDDSIDLLEFILGSLKQVARAAGAPARRFSTVVFSLGDVQEKTARISRNLNDITTRLGDFLLHVYTPDEARAIVRDVEVYFKHYLTQLVRLRSGILRELDGLRQPERLRDLAECEGLFRAEQERIPRFLRAGGRQEPLAQALQDLHGYYRPDGRMDRLCESVRTNVMHVLGKLTSYLKELERRSNRLEFLDLRLRELAALEEGRDPREFLREFLSSGAAPLDMNDADEDQKAEPPPPRLRDYPRKTPPRIFKRPARLDSLGTETHEEMRLRLLREFLDRRYPEDGPLDRAALADGDFASIALLLKCGLLNDGLRLSRLGKDMLVDPESRRALAGETFSLTGPETILRERRK